MMSANEEEECPSCENNQNNPNLQMPLKIEILQQIKQETVIVSPAEPQCNSAVRDDIEIKINNVSFEEDCEDETTQAGVHFLTDEDNDKEMCVDINQENDNYERKKNEFFEYLTQSDGSVVCKLCGEVLSSRTHWYRHKYKLHANNVIQPAPLFKCSLCNIFFKSRKGYLGHYSTRHSEVVDKPRTVILESGLEDYVEVESKTKKKDPVKQTTDWKEQRVKEEKLVADIIDRVKKECEAQGAAITRRGYSRRSTVMNSCY